MIFVGVFQSDQMKMYECITDTVQQHIVPRTDFAAIIPSGTAIQNARSSYFGDKLTRDGYHLNELGRLIAGYTWFCMLTAKDIKECKIGPFHYESMLDQAARLLKKPVELTQLQKDVLIYRKQHLLLIYCCGISVEACHLVLAALQPAQRALAGLLGIFVSRGVFHALVKGHGDVAAQIGLDLHGLFRTHKYLMSINVRGEIDTLFLDLSQGCQRKHLESAGVRQNGTIPIHKLMQAAEIVYELVARTNVQVVSIGKLDLTIYVNKVNGGNAALDSGASSDVHKNGSLYISVYGMENGASCAALGQNQFKHFQLLLNLWFSSLRLISNATGLPWGQ